MNLVIKLPILFCLIILKSCFAQNTPSDTPAVLNKEFDRIIKSHLSFDVPVIGVDELKSNYNDYIILDAREIEEFNTSHLPGAIHIGYQNIQWQHIEHIQKNQKILVYCSIGYRSEKVGKELLNKGYNCYNLYGSIFEWVNKSYDVLDQNEAISDKVHGYDKNWSQWIDNENITITY